MNQENKAKLTKYIVCFCIASLITFVVIWLNGFLVYSTAVNIQILSDAFCISGILMLVVSGMLFVSGEGALIGIGFVLRNVVLTFFPMGRLKHETYAAYRERKLGEKGKRNDKSILLTGLLFLTVGIVFTAIWYVKFYDPSVLV